MSQRKALPLPERRGHDGFVTKALDRLIPYERLAHWREGVAGRGARLVVTNGCFDLLHLGHVTYLERARELGDMLLVGVNGDTAVRQLKGEGRPLNPETDRALVVAALRVVDAVCIFPEKRATNFLRVARPDVYVKGGDYTLDTLDAEERRTVEDAGGRIVLLPMVEGKSTTETIRKFHRSNPH